MSIFNAPAPEPVTTDNTAHVSNTPEPVTTNNSEHVSILRKILNFLKLELFIDKSIDFLLVFIALWAGFQVDKAGEKRKNLNEYKQNLTNIAFELKKNDVSSELSFSQTAQAHKALLQKMENRSFNSDADIFKPFVESSIDDYLKSVDSKTFKNKVLLSMISKSYSKVNAFELESKQFYLEVQKFILSGTTDSSQIAVLLSKMEKINSDIFTVRSIVSNTAPMIVSELQRNNEKSEFTELQLSEIAEDYHRVLQQVAEYGVNFDDSTSIVPFFKISKFTNNSVLLYDDSCYVYAKKAIEKIGNDKEQKNVVAYSKYYMADALLIRGLNSRYINTTLPTDRAKINKSTELFEEALSSGYPDSVDIYYRLADNAYRLANTENFVNYTNSISEKILLTSEALQTLPAFTNSSIDGSSTPPYERLATNFKNRYPLFDFTIKTFVETTNKQVINETIK